MDDNNPATTDVHYALTNHIDCSGIANFEPLFSSSNAFDGTFDGNEYVIADLTINKPDLNDVGLFRFVTGAISNVGLDSVSIKGNGNIGGIAGNGNGSIITNVYVTGQISGVGVTGGILGKEANLTISTSYSTASVIGTASTTFAGGIIGLGTTINISNSYSKGDITGISTVAGVATTSFGTTSDSYAAGSVKGTGSNVTGFLAGNSPSCTDSYFDSLATGQRTSDCEAKAKTTAELQSPTSNTGIYENWDATIWDFGTSSEYPVHIFHHTVSPLSPLDNSSVSIDDVPDLVWHKIAQAKQYTLQLSKDETFGELVIDSTLATEADTTLAIAEGLLQTGTPYYWRVRSHQGEKRSPWSDTFQFTLFTPSPPEAVRLLSPRNDTAFSASEAATFYWSKPDRASTYTFQLSKTEDFSAPVESSTLATAEDTTFTLADGVLEPDASYYWRVQAANSGGSSAWSETFRFSTFPLAPEAVALLSPANDAAFSASDPPEFQWASAARADSYTFQLSEAASFASPLIDSTLATADDTTFILPPATLREDRAYHWRARGNNAGGASDWPEAHGFMTFPLAPEAVALRFPANNAAFVASDPPEFEWTSAARTDSYTFQLSEEEDFGTTLIDTMLSTSNDTTLTLPEEILKEENTYYWRVQARNAGGDAPWSEGYRFMTLSSPPASVQLLSPVHDTTLLAASTPEFRWTRSKDAEEYIFQLSDTSTFAEERIFIEAFPLAPDTTVPFPAEAMLAPDATYYWRVQARNAGGNSAWSSPFRLNTFPLPPEAVQLLSPVDSAEFAVNDVPEFKWTRSERADTYQFQVSEEALFGSSVIDTLVSPARDTTFMLPADTLKPETRYYWRVQAKNAGGASAWSEVVTFKTLKSVSNEEEDVPLAFALSQNYPNPFNPVTQIRYSLPEAVYVRLEVRNILGQRVVTLVNERKNAGRYVVSLDGSTLASGVYFYTIEAGNFRQVRKMVLIK